MLDMEEKLYAKIYVYVDKNGKKYTWSNLKEVHQNVNYG